MKLKDAYSLEEKLWQTLVEFSGSVVSDSSQSHGPQHPRLPCPSPTPGYSNSCPSSWWYHPAISSSVVPFFSCLQSFPASGSFPVSQFFASGDPSIGAQVQHDPFLWIFRTDFLQDGLVGSPGSPRDYSPTPQFKSINSSVLSFFNGSALTSIPAYWINQSFDHMDLCWQSNVSAFQYAV